MTPKLTFLGGAGTVTGSKYLLEHAGRSLLVDCGLFQGYKNLRLRNWSPLPVRADNIDAVLLTHAHLDHSGYLPLLVRQGFKGPIYSTEATRDLCRILLEDSGRLQEQDAAFANRHHTSRHSPALPLYTEADARRCLKQFHTTPFDKTISLQSGAKFRFLRAGHILGAASIIVEAAGQHIGFSGDIGRYDDPLMIDPVSPGEVDYLLIESTYGNRKHSSVDAESALEEIVTRTVRRGGTVVIPAFAVGRAQSLIYHLGRLKASGRLPLWPVFLDSPMAMNATEIFLRHQKDQRLSRNQMKLMDKDINYVRTAEESKALTASVVPKVIISASGMATGGRVLHHLAEYLPDHRSTVVMAGFQAGGTRGAALLAGASSLRIHGRDVPVRAEIAELDMLSAHAGQDELVRWAEAIKGKPRQVFVVHGEPAASDELRRLLRDKLDWDCHVAEHGETVELT
jgi:metallo-beta-lactamase family protein